MTKTFADLQAQIQSLQAQAEKLRESEIAEVVARMRTDIKNYGITIQQLFGRVAGAKPNIARRSATAKYSDGQGNSWGGRGPRPQWLRSALAAGRQLEEFATAGSARPAKSPPKASSARKSRAPKASASKRTAKSTTRTQGKVSKKVASTSPAEPKAS